jgi:hypothetical protein
LYKFSPFISEFSAIRFFRAFLLTSVLLMPQVRTPPATNRIVAASTIHPPHARCGTNNKTSMRKASRVTRSVGRRRIMRASRYRGECEGACRCAVPARMRQTSVRKAATGWTMRRVAREWRVEAPIVKLASV